MAADPSRPQIAFFSRGKGRGHATPDAAIATALQAINPSLQIAFYSYSTGLETLQGLGWSAIDLKLPENNPVWETAIVVTQCLADARPDLVVSHEEFVVPPVAKAARLPSVFITDWFAPSEALIMQALRFADEVLILDDPGYQDIPPYLTDTVTFVGTVLRAWPKPIPTRAQARQQLGLAEDSLVVIGVPGGADAHSELVAPIFALVLAAFDRLDVPAKTLVWVAADKEVNRLRRRTEQRPDLRFMAPHNSIVSTMLAADVVVTKGNRITVLECEALGVPSISISFGLNPVDDQRIARVTTNVALRARGLRVSDLAAHLSAAALWPPAQRSVRPTVDDGAPVAAVVERIAQHLTRRACCTESSS